jgi:hypothetical protein
MNENPNPFALSPEQVATWQAGHGRPTNGSAANGKAQPILKTGRAFVQYNYKAQLELAKSSRNALLAVQAELYYLHFKCWDKTAPIALGNAVFRALGFCNKDKTRALKELENAKWIYVQWRERKSPLVTLLKGFKL